MIADVPVFSFERLVISLVINPGSYSTILVEVSRVGLSVIKVHKDKEVFLFEEFKISNVY